jgi:hypothetical protein
MDDHIKDAVQRWREMEMETFGLDLMQEAFLEAQNAHVVGKKAI